MTPRYGSRLFTERPASTGGGAGISAILISAPLISSAAYRTPGDVRKYDRPAYVGQGTKSPGIRTDRNQP